MVMQFVGAQLHVAIGECGVAQAMAKGPLDLTRDVVPVRQGPAGVFRAHIANCVQIRNATQVLVLRIGQRQSTTRVDPTRQEICNNVSRERPGQKTDNDGIH